MQTVSVFSGSGSLHREVMALPPEWNPYCSHLGAGWEAEIEHPAPSTPLPSHSAKSLRQKAWIQEKGKVERKESSF